MQKYILAPDVLVRNEEFGLLFYLCKTTNLVFINSKNLLKAEDLKAGLTLTDLKENKTLINLLEKLEQRGLIQNVN